VRERECVVVFTFAMLARIKNYHAHITHANVHQELRQQQSDTVAPGEGPMCQRITRRKHWLVMPRMSLACRGLHTSTREQQGDGEGRAGGRERTTPVERPTVKGKDNCFFAFHREQQMHKNL
jgi:hypothetical protein